MIDSSVKVLGRLWDKIALTLTNSGDLSLLVDVRPLRRNEVSVVADELNPARNADTHRSRLSLQDDGVLVYLIAWLDGKPVGHGLLLWRGPTGSPKQHINKVCPYVEDLWVRKDLRSRGVGARIIAEMTILAVANGHDSISLSVGVDNRRAIRLYERMGFTTSRIPLFTLSGMVAMANGETQFWSEKCQYMFKSLDFREERELEVA